MYSCRNPASITKGPSLRGWAFLSFKSELLDLDLLLAVFQNDTDMRL